MRESQAVPILGVLQLRRGKAEAYSCRARAVGASGCSGARAFGEQEVWVVGVSGYGVAVRSSRVWVFEDLGFAA